MILVVSNSRDFATDFVIAKLRERSAEYVRLDLDLLHLDRITLDPCSGILNIDGPVLRTTVCGDSVSSVLFRAPTHLRESSSNRRDPEEQLARHQWAAFARSLVVFEDCRWVNHPWATFRAENKPYQLRVAGQVGFAIPETLVTNNKPDVDNAIWMDNPRVVAIKALDSFLVRLTTGEDAFCYTQKATFEEFNSEDMSSMPAIVQQFLHDKLDLRVTVVGDRCYAASIKVNGAGVDGDWRLAKDKALFEPVNLPNDVQTRCVELVRRLGLTFGAIDLARVGDDYFFIEVNPTGEWAWLVTQCGFPIDASIAEELLKAKNQHG